MTVHVTDCDINDRIIGCYQWYLQNQKMKILGIVNYSIIQVLLLIGNSVPICVML